MAQRAAPVVLGGKTAWTDGKGRSSFWYLARLLAGITAWADLNVSLSLGVLVHVNGNNTLCVPIFWVVGSFL